MMLKKNIFYKLRILAYIFRIAKFVKRIDYMRQFFLIFDKFLIGNNKQKNRHFGILECFLNTLMIFNVLFLIIFTFQRQYVLKYLNR